MSLTKKILIIAFSCSFTLGALEEAELTWENEGPTAQEFNGKLHQAMLDGDWWAVVDNATVLSYHFPTSPFSQDAAFYIGEAYLKLGHPYEANDYFTVYLNSPNTLRKFEEAISYKFGIAERFKNGEKKPLFDSHKAPKWLSAKEDAIQIYDEVIATTPHSEFAAKSLLGKAQIQLELEEYKESLETLDVLTRRFPKHELSAAAYLEKVHVYYLECQGKSLDPDLLDLAKVTVQKFKLAFPREPRIKEAEDYIEKTKEAFAQNLLNTGAFFQKTKKEPAAKIYYKKVLSQYPETSAAISAREKLNFLDEKS